MENTELNKENHSTQYQSSCYEEDYEPKGFISFDDILENKIKLGKIQFLAYVTTGLVWLAEGSELVFNPLLTLVLSQQDFWDISDKQVNLVTSALFLGFFLGAFPSGYFGDKFGRRNSILYILIAMSVCGIATAFSWNVWILMFFRFIFGIFIGLSIPIAVTLQSEITPVKHRGKIIVWTMASFVLGELSVVGLAYVFFESLEAAKWRQFALTLQIFKVIAIFWTLKYFIESPRYLFWKGRKEEAIKITNHMIKGNNENDAKKLVANSNSNNDNNDNNPEEVLIEKQENMLKLTDDEIDQIDEWIALQKTITEGEKQEQNTWKQFLEPYYLMLTIRVAFLWFGLTIAYFGTVYAMTTILDGQFGKDDSLTPEQKKNKQLTELFLATAIELPSYISAGYLIDKPWMGRKKMMLIGFLISTVVCLVTFCYQTMNEITFTVLMAMARFAFSLSFVTISPFTSEVYPTSIRNKGFGLTSSCGRFAGILLLWILDFFYKISYFGPFILFAVLCGICFVIQYFMADTFGKELDGFKIEKNDLAEVAKSIRQSIAKSFKSSQL